MAQRHLNTARYVVTITKPGLTERQIRALAERLRCAVVLALPERTRSEQVIVQPKINDTLEPPPE